MTNSFHESGYPSVKAAYRKAFSVFRGFSSMETMSFHMNDDSFIVLKKDWFQDGFTAYAKRIVSNRTHDKLDIHRLISMGDRATHTEARHTRRDMVKWAREARLAS